MMGTPPRETTPKSKKEYMEQIVEGLEGIAKIRGGTVEAEIESMRDGFYDAKKKTQPLTDPESDFAKLYWEPAETERESA